MKTRKEVTAMTKVILDAKVPVMDGETRIVIEGAKRAARIDWSYTCFKGKTHLAITDMKKCMWLAQEKKENPYI